MKKNKKVYQTSIFMKSQLNALQFTINPSTVYISTDPNQSSYANITVTVENTGTAPISVNTIAITLPEALAPANTLSSITPVAGNTKLWNFDALESNAGEFDATAQNGNYVNINQSDSYSFTLQLVTLVSVITQSATNVIALVTFADGSLGQPVLLNVNITTAQASIQMFNSNISNISPGQNAMLKWNCPGISYCIISSIGTGKFDPTGTHQVSPAETTVYTLYAYADGVILSAQWAITVDNVQVNLFAGADAQTSVNYGDNINLVWKCQNADRVKLTADTDISIPPLITGTNTPLKGIVTVGPIEQLTQFTFSAFEGTNFAQAETTISINDVSVAYSAGPNTVLWKGDTITFSWNIVSASAVVSCWPPMENGPSLQKLSGSADYNPGEAASMVCNITAKGLVNNHRRTVSNDPPLALEFQPVSIDSFTISPAIIMPEGDNANQAVLAWSAQAQVVTINNDIGTVAPEEGIMIILNPLNGTTYTLTVGTNQHPTQQTAQVTVVNAFGPYTFNSFNTDRTLIFTDFVIPNPGPMSALPHAALYTAVLTGVVATNAPPPYAVENYYNENNISQSYFALMTWPPTSNPPYPSFEWADPNNQSGTITLVAYLEGGGSDTLEDFIKQL